MSEQKATGQCVKVAGTDHPGSFAYDIVIRPGLLDDAGKHLADACPAHRYAVITDTRVADLYGERLLEAFSEAGLSAQLFPFAAGEWNKTRDTWGRVTDCLLRAGVGRDAAVVAAGGGVVGDVAGFVAATYMRGLPVVQIPTTLLAMLDSSVGGKTGVDTPAGKNLVGAFHQPSLVLVDPTLLSTLPKYQLAAGLAEAFKHGLIRDSHYFEEIVANLDMIFQRAPDVLADLIRRSVEIKAEVVGEDVRERGYRQTLNFGHTVAHAVELLSGYELLHGEAVAIGLVAEASIGEAVGVTRAGVSQRIRAVCGTAGLPVEFDAAIDRESFFKALAVDKKSAGGRTRYTLLADIGQVARSEEDDWSHEVAEEVVDGVLFS